MSTITAAIIQARMGSSRLPGKVLLPLGERFVLEHIIRRVQRAEEIDTVVVATSTKTADDIIEWCGKQNNAVVFRGDEEHVLDRMHRAAVAVQANEVVRITGDCPLISPAVIDRVVTRRREAEADYASNILTRTFPRGLDVEAFSRESFDRVRAGADTAAEFEHVTLRYRNGQGGFDTLNISSEEVFDEYWLQDRTDLRLTLDELADYLLLRTVFENVEYNHSPSFSNVVRYIDEEALAEVNASVAQKKAHDEVRDQG